MSLLTSLLASGASSLTDDRYGVWKMTSNFSVPVSTNVGAGTTPVNRFTFDTLLSGEFPDFNISTHVLTVTKKGIYSVSWDGGLVSNDSSGGSVRRAVIRKTTSSLAVPVLFTDMASINTGGAPSSAYGINRTMFLDVDDVVEFGFEYNGSAGIVFSDTTALQIVLLSTL